MVRWTEETKHVATFAATDGFSDRDQATPSASWTTRALTAKPGETV